MDNLEVQILKTRVAVQRRQTRRALGHELLLRPVSSIFKLSSVLSFLSAVLHIFDLELVVYIVLCSSCNRSKHCLEVWCATSSAVFNFARLAPDGCAHLPRGVILKPIVSFAKILTVNNG